MSLNAKCLPRPSRRLPKGRWLKIDAVMISCPERARMRCQTLEDLSKTDWAGHPLRVVVDPGCGNDYRKRQTHCALLALEKGLEGQGDFILYLEDDLAFNRHIHHNLQHWGLLRTGRVTLASLYNPGVKELACDLGNRARLVPPRSVFGSQAFLIARETARRLVDGWNKIQGMQDIRISRLAGRLGSPVFYHAPSLVQHIGHASVWGGRFHQAVDYDPLWRA